MPLVGAWVPCGLRARFGNVIRGLHGVATPIFQVPEGEQGEGNDGSEDCMSLVVSGLDERRFVLRLGSGDFFPGRRAPGL